MAAIRRHGVARVLMTSATVALLAGCAEQFNNLRAPDRSSRSM